MKKPMQALLIASTLVSLIACGGSGDDGDSQPPTGNVGSDNKYEVFIGIV